MRGISVITAPKLPDFFETRFTLIGGLTKSSYLLFGGTINKILSIIISHAHCILTYNMWVNKDINQATSNTDSLNIATPIFLLYFEALAKV
jgi:hypothetical protein